MSARGKVANRRGRRRIPGRAGRPEAWRSSAV